MNNFFKLKYINVDESELEKIGFDKTYIRKAVDKHNFLSVKIYDLTCAQANILKQTALANGTDCAVHREIITGKVEKSSCILSGTVSELKKISSKLKSQPLKLSVLADELDSLLNKNLPDLLIREKTFDFNKNVYIMGILNVTPDSFSDGGKYLSLDSAIEHFNKLKKDGADIIDIGGESTRPNSTAVSSEEEISRIIPVIKKIREFDSEIIISVDTRNSKTAKAALDVGADIINDVSSGSWDDKMFEVVKEYNCPIILNHSKESLNLTQSVTDYSDLTDDIYEFFVTKIKNLLDLGVEKTKIIIDPGFGFGKTQKQNFEIVSKLKEFKSLSCPILVGHSRKSFIKNAVNSDDIQALDNATVVLSEILINNGANILRVHNVKSNKALLQIKDALK